MGGGISSLSKVVVVSPSTRPGVDIDYLFGQVAVDRALVDYRSNCGNLTAAVGPFAVDEGLVDVADGKAALTLHNRNLDQTIEARFEVAGGRAVVEGDTVLDGVAGQGAPIRLSFLDPGGAVTGRLLPTGRARDVLDVPGVRGDRGHANRRVDGAGRRSRRRPGPERSRTTGCNRGRPCPHRPAGGDPPRRGRRHGDRAGNRERAQDRLRRPARRRGDPERRGVAAEAVDLSARVISMGRPHRALPLTAALALAAAARIPGTVAAEVARPGAGSVSDPSRIGHPSGLSQEIAVDLAAADPPRLARLTVTRTARRLMEGRVLIPAHHLASASDTD